ncbi:putative 37S ribosomal protein S5, mitochondrial [Neolecta irregularis DAH-3]|uniref:Small ribosomal subunit protein uS5m n=1 Tax=Neolecta irregularis (strain DAH-3) TaxID=1198029 RepID=A0A1U7LWM7_NEOID|nr:putative 37S ribosomal protein S5, mitochondrial [Neolecta irregularis DAH-3]|eukprot:OLL27085.1 putative 37S ribosomal protein S5, mitochondrial [Neolecta irregularis DAH-3]
MLKIRTVCRPGNFVFQLRYLHGARSSLFRNNPTLLNKEGKNKSPCEETPISKNDLQSKESSDPHIPSSPNLSSKEENESSSIINDDIINDDINNDDDLYRTSEEIERFINHIRPRSAHLSMPYFSDLSVMDPRMDYPQPGANIARRNLLREKNMIQEEMVEEQPVQKKGIIKQPQIRSSNKSKTRKIAKEDASVTETQEALMAERTGLSRKQLDSLTQCPLVIHRVVNQTKMGKLMSMYALMVIGNGDGLVGYGEGKDAIVEKAIRKAFLQAAKSLDYIPRFEERTFHGDVKVKFHAVELAVRARPPGFGVRANHLIYEICRCAGIKDISAKLYRSKNPMNVIKAFFQAMKSQKLPEIIAKERGKNIYDVRKSYYGH